MKRISLLALGLATLVFAKPAKHDGASGIVDDVGAQRRADTPDLSDWKYAHGWDGTTLPPIGTIVTSPNATADGDGARTNNIGGVFICEDINWGGKCGYAVQPTGVCISLGSDWNNKISSFGPDNCNACYLWDHQYCRFYNPAAGNPVLPPVWYFEYPGDATGGLGGNDPWNDRVSSFMCFPTPCRSG